jgi:Carboxypeptidase regulatory-like domain/CARDB
MTGLIHRAVRTCHNSPFGPFMAEALECRRLFTLDLSLTDGQLLVRETNDNVSNFTTMQLMNDSTALNITEASDDINETIALGADSWIQSDDLRSVTGPLAGITSILVDTDDGHDQLMINSINIPVTIRPRGTGTEAIELGEDDAATGAQLITGAINVDATNSTNLQFDLDDSMDPNDIDPTFTSTGILDFAAAPINFIAPPQLAGSTAPTVDIAAFGGTGHSGMVVQEDPNSPTIINYQLDANGPGTVGVEQLNANSTVVAEPEGASGTEKLFLGSDGLISTVKGTVQLQGNGGSVSLVVNDSSDTVPHTFSTSIPSDLVFEEDGVQIATASQPISAFTLLTGPAADTVNLVAELNNFVATVQSAGPDNISVSGELPSTTVDLIGSAAGDNISLRGDTVQGTVNISNPTGLETVTVDGSNTSVPHVISASDSSVTGIGGTYNLANLKSLSIIGGTAFDNFTVTPSATVPITVDGGPSSGATTDRLDVTTTNVTGTELQLQNATSQSGTFTFTNRQPVTFNGFATITPSIGDLTGTVFNQQTTAVVAGATVVVDENNNGVADPGEPTTTTDANGTYFFTALPVGTFGLLATAIGLQNASVVSVPISAGVDVVAADIPVVTTLTAPGGPDLIATVVATAPGAKSGSNKPRAQLKVSNIGASMTSAVSLKIILLASSDTVQDLTDQQLLTASTVPVLLKANKFKTFVLTGNTSTSLPKGNYFVLALVDADNDVTESNEANNVAVSTKAVPLAPSIADLTGKFSPLPKKASKSKLLNVALTIQNLGTIPAVGTIDFDFFASTDKILDDSDLSLGTDFPFTAHIAPGRSQPARFKLSINPSLPAGTYSLVARVNSTSSISESDLTNNLVFSTTPISIS